MIAESILISEALLLIYSSCHYPNLWKKSLVIPLSKVASRSTPSETRPIANLPHFAKVFDSLLTHQLTEYLEEHKLLSPFQAAYRRHNSTQTALFKITEDIHAGVDAGLVTILPLFDFKSAFDSINHEHFFRTIHNLNFSDKAVKLLHSYLSGRCQAVIGKNGDYSEFMPNSSGVPQGSTPGSIIFLIFINSILSCLRHCGDKCMLFADDLQIYFQCRPSEFESAISKLNEDAAAVVKWTSDNGLILNVRQTKAILFASVQHHMRIDASLIPPIIVDRLTILTLIKIKH